VGFCFEDLANAIVELPKKDLPGSLMVAVDGEEEGVVKRIGDEGGVAFGDLPWRLGAEFKAAFVGAVENEEMSSPVKEEDDCHCLDDEEVVSDNHHKWSRTPLLIAMLLAGSNRPIERSPEGRQRQPWLPPLLWMMEH
ncbi:hypothetical protein ACLOJK_036372, partial [Asimina triloba]